MKRLVFCFFSLAACQAILAQDSGKTLANILLGHWQTSKNFSLAVANAMPDDDYSFKATPPEMSFGEQMNHIAQANANYCSMALDTPSPVKKSSEAGKPAAVQNLTTSYDYCISGLEKMTDADLLKPISKNGHTITAFELFWGAYSHAAHHRGQAEVYLRLKGVTPPAYKF
ncbi:MAG: DinB family protein [Acidobacteriaceae bacterium]|nr:DinB family protein [Acidobacteriaceae bacterium]MBV8569283.1 DinB family protein [Acidobacteriaceae bacterium]